MKKFVFPKCFPRMPSVLCISGNIPRYRSGRTKISFPLLETKFCKVTNILPWASLTCIILASGKAEQINKITKLSGILSVKMVCQKQFLFLNIFVETYQILLVTNPDPYSICQNFQYGLIPRRHKLLNVNLRFAQLNLYQTEAYPR